MKISSFASSFAVTVSLVAGSPKHARNLFTIKSYIFFSFSSLIFPIWPVGNIAGCAGSVFFPSFGFTKFLFSKYCALSV